jgi:uncharacterized membrane protein
VTALIIAVFTPVFIMAPHFASDRVWLIGVWIEILLMATAIIATAIITKQHGDLLNSIFNFLGVLLILELDDLTAKVLPLEIKTAKFKIGHGKLRNLRRAKFVFVGSFCFAVTVYLLW